MDLKNTLQTAVELSKVLEILRPSDRFAEENRHFVAWYILSTASEGFDLSKGTASKIVEKYIESRDKPMTERQKEVMQEMFNRLEKQGFAEAYLIAQPD